MGSLCHRKVKHDHGNFWTHRRKHDHGLWSSLILLPGRKYTIMNSAWWETMYDVLQSHAGLDTGTWILLSGGTKNRRGDKLMTSNPNLDRNTTDSRRQCENMTVKKKHYFYPSRPPPPSNHSTIQPSNHLHTQNQYEKKPREVSWCWTIEFLPTALCCCYPRGSHETIVSSLSSH